MQLPRYRAYQQCATVRVCYAQVGVGDTMVLDQFVKVCRKMHDANPQLKDEEAKSSKEKAAVEVS